jgi:glycosyltransferase involved in cell wall biosynthesis
VRVLHLTSTLGPSAVGKHLSLVAPELATEFQQDIVNLGAHAPFTQRLGECGVAVTRWPWRGLLDFTSHRELRRRVLDERYDCVHVWGDTAAVAANALHLPGLAPIDVPLVVADSHDDTTWLGKLERRIRARAVTVCDLPPAIDMTHITPANRADHGVEDDAELIVAVGQFDTVADLRTAAWAFDILIYLRPQATLMLVGDGPQRSRLEHTLRTLQRERYRVVFVPQQSDVRPVLAMADVVMVTHRIGGVNVALEAMAAERAVIVRDTPELVSVVGEAGLVIPQGEPSLFTKAIDGVLRDVNLRGKLEVAAKARAQAIGTQRAIEHWRRIYHDVAAIRRSRR